MQDNIYYTVNRRSVFIGIKQQKTSGNNIGFPFNWISVAVDVEAAAVAVGAVFIAKTAMTTTTTTKTSKALVQLKPKAAANKN